jgi:hypothetical protein
VKVEVGGGGCSCDGGAACDPTFWTGQKKDIDGYGGAGSELLHDCTTFCGLQIALCFTFPPCLLVSLHML